MIALSITLGDGGIEAVYGNGLNARNGKCNFAAYKTG